MRHVTGPALFAIGLLLGCTGTSPPSGTVLGPEGGFIRADGVGLDVPPGALETNVEFRIERISVPAGYRAVGGTAFRFSPAGIEFSTPVTVRFAVGASEDSATIFWSRPGTDSLGALDTRPEGDAVVASVTHFSVGLAGWPDEDANTAVDAAVPADAPVDGGTVDGGTLDAGEAGVTGVTCEVWHRTSVGIGVPCTGEHQVLTDVPFDFYYNVDGSGSWERSRVKARRFKV